MAVSCALGFSLDPSLTSHAWGEIEKLQASLVCSVVLFLVSYVLMQKTVTHTLYAMK